MNKTALKNLATRARIELLNKVEAQALKYGITADLIKKTEVESSDAIFIDGKQLPHEEKVQRNKLIARIHQNGFHQVMEEVAYTWFNRFTAIRFMEVNEYILVRPLSSSQANNPEPDMIKEALNLNFDIDKEYIYDLKMNNETDQLFKYLIIKQCNELNRYLPFMFEKIDGYSELLFPQGMLAPDSFLREMTDINNIPEDHWRKVEVIGWLYQYYISDEKDRVIKAKKRYKTEEIPFATQLFTPEWIVRYMVQNSLGRYWIESHPEHRDLLDHWEYYLDNPNPEYNFEEKLAPYINKELKVEDIKCFDPAMGSGHILVYMFDVLFEIYTKCGYIEREIPKLIIENNLYGLDIDDRAYQLACFSVVMKAMEYNKRFFRTIDRDGLKLNLASIQETNGITVDEIAFIVGEDSDEFFKETKSFIEQFKDAKIIGSLLKLSFFDKAFIEKRIHEIENNPDMNLFDLEMKDKTLSLLKSLLKQANIMADQYDVFITNPPYVGRNYLSPQASKYLDKHYPDVKTDLFSAFIEYSFYATKKNGQMGFMTPYVWMFLLSYQKLRGNLIKDRNISSLVQLEYSGFDEATVPICTFTLRNYYSETKGQYIKLSDFKGSSNQPIKTKEAVQNPTVSYRYSADQNQYEKIPGNPIAFWLSQQMTDIFQIGTPLSEFGQPVEGIKTGNNDLFLRFWHEVNGEKFSEFAYEKPDKTKWLPIAKGGSFRRWYGNNDLVINWENNGETLIDYPSSTVSNRDLFFTPAITWTYITSGMFSMRYLGEQYLYNNKGPGCFVSDKNTMFYLLGLTNSKVIHEVLKFLAPTLDFKPGNIRDIPVIFNENLLEEVVHLVTNNIAISKIDWDSFETSWDFKQHPLLKYKKDAQTIKSAFINWETFAEKQFEQLKSNEEKINRIFIELYGLQNELTSEIEEKDVTIRKADFEREMKSFISYAIGCMFGRYSLDEEGLIYAGGEFDSSRFKTYKPDEDNVIPILFDESFENDLATRFVDFIQVTFGKETLEQNLSFIADSLKRRRGETTRETIRRYLINDFFKDHISNQLYKKRPIYWLFTSGKEKAFNCIIYMHRYDRTTLSRIRTDYLHELQARNENTKNDLLDVINGQSSSREINDAKRALRGLERKMAELKTYDEVLHHMADMRIELDLDNGVKVNYEKFEGLVAKL